MATPVERPAASLVAEVSFTTGPEDQEMHAVAVDAALVQALGLTPGLRHELRVWTGTRERRDRSAVVAVTGAAADGEGRLRLAPRLAAALGVAPGRRVFVERVALPPCEELDLRALEPLPPLPPEALAAYAARVLQRGFVPVCAGMELRLALPGIARPARLAVERPVPEESRFTARTRVVVLPPAPAAEPAPGDSETGPGGAPDPGAVRWDEIGGLERQVREVRELLEFPLRAPEALRRAGIQPCRGVLLFGPPGTGKSLLVRALASATRAHIERLAGPELASGLAGGGERALAAAFERAAARAPSIVLLDEVDAVAPRRERGAGPGLTAALLALMDGIDRKDGVVVAATTNRIHALDPALRRPGRFAREVHVGPPDAAGRLEILRIHAERMPLTAAAHAGLGELAARTHGHVGADLMGLCFEAGMNALRRAADLVPDRGGAPAWDAALADLVVEPEDFDRALPRITPSALREAFFARPGVRFDDIGGYDEVKRRLVEVACLPLREPERFRTVRLKPPRGIVLHGPPGTGKTLLARATAAASGANLLLVKGPELFTKWVGESEERLRELFEVARRTRPCIIFIDEIDALLGARGRDTHAGVGDSMVNQFLAELDGAEETDGILVIGATNRLDRLDPAVLRPGRLGEHVEVGPPDSAARASIVRLNLAGVPTSDPGSIDEVARAVAERTDGWSGAEVVALVERAKYRAVREAHEDDEPLVELGWLLDEIGPWARARPGGPA